MSSYTTTNLPFTSITNTGAITGSVTAGGIAGTGYSNVTISGAGASGSTLSYNGYATTWTQPNTNFNDGTSPVMTIPNGSKTVILEDKATLDVKGTVKINGIDLEERLKTIEKVLMIPERDATMEAKYPSLKKKYDEYINLLGKYRTFEAIKGDDNGTT